MIFDPAGVVLAFPERNIFLSVADVAVAMGLEEAPVIDRDKFIMVETLRDDLPENLFTTQGMSHMPLAQVMSLMEGMGDDLINLLQ